MVGFDECFWPEDVTVFISVSDLEKDSGYLQSWINMQYITGKPYLMGMVYGDVASDVEDISKEDLQMKGKHIHLKRHNL